MNHKTTAITLYVKICLTGDFKFGSKFQIGVHQA